MLSLVTVLPVITAFHSYCLPHHVFDQVNLWPAWVGIETAIYLSSGPEFGRNVVKEETTQKNYQDEDKKSAINKN